MKHFQEMHNNNQSKKSRMVLFLIFLAINFLGLFLGAFFTNQAVTADWYLSLNKSPITPPGWFFGFAWTTIMLSFAIYLSLLYHSVSNKSKLITLFIVQWILNFSWNPLFFNLHYVSLALLNIIALAILVTVIFVSYYTTIRWKSILLLPYVLWIYVASYLNLYIFINN
ncbi:MAG: TspO/MBR family protein [Marinicellaceae bacterium]